jgi:N-acetylglucosamine kinase-like BadF-type ATPase
MILIADSGSTKTSWRYIDEKQQIFQAKTIGFNPYLETASTISATILATLLPQLPEYAKVSKVFYYGAGCGQQRTCEIMQTALQTCFADAQIFVAEDMLAATRALCGTSEGIVCILGTGSNSCFYDGQKIGQIRGGLGIMLGDEGSGTYLGRKLVKDYLEGNLPKTIQQNFDKRFKTNKAEILDNVYSKPYPNRYLASFAKFLFDHKADFYCSQIIHQCFTDFFDNTICKYPQYQAVKVHFTGSIAFYFSSYLQRIAQEKNICIGNIIEEPIAGLTLYHQEFFNL